MSLKKFLAKHAGELNKIANVLGTVIGALPMDRQDKETLGNSVKDLLGSAASIAESVKNMSSVDVSLDKRALKAAIEDMLPSIIDAISERVFHIAKEKDAALLAAPAQADAAKPKESGAAAKSKRAAPTIGPKKAVQ